MLSIRSKPPIAVHPTFRVDSCEPVLNRRDSSKIFSYVLFSDKTNRDHTTIKVQYRNPKDDHSVTRHCTTGKSKGRARARNTSSSCFGWAGLIRWPSLSGGREPSAEIAARGNS